MSSSTESCTFTVNDASVTLDGGLLVVAASAVQSDVDVDVRRQSKGILGFGRKTSKTLSEGRGSGEKVAQQASKPCALLIVGSAVVAAAAAANDNVKQLRLCLCPPASSTFFCRHPR